ncbi:hypothetical protein BDP55DRAFT_661875 [Colletotrichum godetiae]|uniref:Uncharacterized protein n=1 Tax=Colletotrichum godetiae TaxID=1209918 RepID=A0AAJ0ETF5_9PEZI|nr:uncharacterized protein BDP55DRAFT_661875 [Colletotrichum godetiae]KAK1676146.1 hypothetical protein BDP55DRAFT_661875 [Colletotrichum godetiae]
MPQNALDLTVEGPLKARARPFPAQKSAFGGVMYSISRFRLKCTLLYRSNSANVLGSWSLFSFFFMSHKVLGALVEVISAVWVTFCIVDVVKIVYNISFEKLVFLDLVRGVIGRV